MEQRLVLIAAVIIGFAVWGAAGQVSGLLAAADAAFDRWERPFHCDEYQQRLEEAIAGYEAILPLLCDEAVQTRAYVLNRLAQAHFELGHAYIVDERDQEETFAKGKDYALESLRLDPEFCRIAEGSFRAALSSADDVSALFWYGNNLGRYLESHMLTAIMGGMHDVRAAFTRAIELDETYTGGGPWRALASFLAQVPSGLGGDLDRARSAFERAIELGPAFIENRVDFACDVLKAKREWNQFCHEIQNVVELGQDEDVMARWPLYNVLALRRAEALALLEVKGEPICGD